jgi:hypothetical protein
MPQVSTSERAAPLLSFSGSSRSTVGLLVVMNLALVGTVLLLFRSAKRKQIASAGAEFESVRTYGAI